MELFHASVYWASLAYFWFVVLGAIFGAFPASLGTVSARLRSNSWVSQVMMPSMARAFKTCFGKWWRLVLTVLSTATITWVMVEYHSHKYAMVFLLMELYYYVACGIVVGYYLRSKTE